MFIPVENTIKLSEMDQVKLMNRIDTKFWFHAQMLPVILEKVSNDYFILEIDGESMLSYSTVYFDTSLDSMYIAHHNGKLNRYKVRQRTYIESGINFLEIKKKNNKGRTLKKRLETDAIPVIYEDSEKEFINLNCPYDSNELSPTLQNTFQRITLVSKNFNERCTIDLHLKFEAENKEVILDDLVIVEIKSDGLPSGSPMARTLKSNGIKKTGFSKYCMGRVLTNPYVKSNSFKPRIRQIRKLIYSDNRIA